MRPKIGLLALTATVTVLASFSSMAGANPASFLASRGGETLALSGAVDFRDQTLGTTLTECPQAGRIDRDPKPLDRRAKDEVERKSSGGNDRRLNQDYSCFPQDETSISINPATPRNIIAGANDYRLGTGSSGFYASTDNGNSWYDGIIPFPTTSARAADGNANGFLPSGGDPVTAYDRDGIAYYAQIAFNRYNDTNGVFVQRSTNGGFTWSRACVPINPPNTPANDDIASCGSLGDPRQPGDGVVQYDRDNDSSANSSVFFNDKEWMTTGPRPVGVAPTCFTAETKTPIAAGSAGCPNDAIGVDRIYVTWTRFARGGGDVFVNGNRINISYSDDRGHSWSPRKEISGSASFCVGTAGRCDFNQGSVPTVNPTTGHLWVAWLNGNTPDEDQYVVARSNDGGTTFTPPMYVAPVFDVNYPRSGVTRGDCTPRGQGFARQVLTNSCFRVNSYGNIVVDKRGGAFADDLYVVYDDNRNGTIKFSNVDVFMYKSTDGGVTWLGPTRVNDDARTRPAGFNRDCGRDPQDITGDPNQCTVAPAGNDQWFPWVDISEDGDLNVVFHDRRLDTDSTASEWPTSRSRLGNYLTWFWGGGCRVARADSRDCVAPEATVMTQPTGPVDPGADPVPGQVQSVFPFRNYTVSDSPYNLDYSFRAGIFMGDYENIDVVGNDAAVSWTDARNGRSSGNQTSPNYQFGRNPSCEQSDAFFDRFSAKNGAGGADKASRSDEAYLVTPCPTDIKDKGNDGHHSGGGDD